MSSISKRSTLLCHLRSFSTGFGWAIICFIVLAAIGYAVHCSTMYYYIGNQRLTIKFVITDHETGVPIDNAFVNQLFHGDPPSDDYEKRIQKANHNHSVLKCTVVGDASFFYRDESVYPVPVSFVANAPGYDSSRRIPFDECYDQINATRHGYTMKIKFQLKKHD